MNLVDLLLRHPDAYLLGEPTGTAVIRRCAEDFCVEENLGFEPDGAGEHQFLFIRKTGENTDWVAQQLARFTKTHPRDIGYAGKKDRHAVTDQWFSVRLPLGVQLDWSAFETDSIQVLRQARHSRKLKTGVLQGNRFSLRLRDVSHPDELQQRFDQLKTSGVPNYFGEQRFGHNYGNISKGELLIAGQLRDKNRQKRGLYISALRSALFNQVVSARIQQGVWNKVAPGDVLMLNASQSCFVCTDEAELDCQSRLQQGDLHLTAPLWGQGGLMTQDAMAEFEQAVVSPWQDWCAGLEALGLRQERRAARVLLQAPLLEQESDSVWRISFGLPAGAFATSLLRELCQPENEKAVSGCSAEVDEQHQSAN
ncbi:tRNA pseudouridine(13) synthase TruD [Nitrincola sp.]|uniref:tRNA pseudouridine(13) synthase TruD n=1 Tax=Nitrincola sp. TaxID=1926584 RepID=UPI003A8EEF28